jgi:hypothetical protein
MKIPASTTDGFMPIAVLWARDYPAAQPSHIPSLTLQRAEMTGCHVERGGRGAFFLVAADVQVPVVGAPVGEPVDEPRIAVVGEDHRLAGGEQRVEVTVRQPVRVFGVWLPAA